MSRPRQLPSNQQYKEEAELLSKVMEWLAPLERAKVKAIRVCDRYNKGYSDVFICANGVLVLAELKASDGIASQHQIEFINDMTKCGAVGGFCKSVRDVADLIEEADRKRIGGLL
jgi:hypothetical protein